MSPGPGRGGGAGGGVTRGPGPDTADLSKGGTDTRWARKEKNDDRCPLGSVPLKKYVE